MHLIKTKAFLSLVLHNHKNDEICFHLRYSSLGKRGCPGRAAAPVAAVQRQLLSLRPAEEAGSEAASAPPGIAAAADFPAEDRLQKCLWAPRRESPRAWNRRERQ